MCTVALRAGDHLHQDAAAYKKRLCCADVVVIEPFFGHQSFFIFISESDAVDGNPVLIWF